MREQPFAPPPPRCHVGPPQKVTEGLDRTLPAPPPLLTLSSCHLAKNPSIPVPNPFPPYQVTEGLDSAYAHS